VIGSRTHDVGAVYGSLGGAGCGGDGESDAAVGVGNGAVAVSVGGSGVDVGTGVDVAARNIVVVGNTIIVGSVAVVAGAIISRRGVATTVGESFPDTSLGNTANSPMHTSAAKIIANPPKPR
jgi:hypothetical protein